MKSLCSYQKFLYRVAQIRNVSVSHSLMAETALDKSKPVPKNILAEKLKETDAIKEKFVGLSNRFKAKHEIYYGKERDLTNFPLITQPDHHPKVRMGFIPDEWFNALYHKTGVTGPYLFLWGGVAFLLQKEIWIIDNHFWEVPGTIVAIYILQRSLGPTVANFYKRIQDKKLWYLSKRMPDIWKLMAQRTAAIAKEDKEIVAVNADLFQATKENVGLQLEAVYRNRFIDLHKAVKSRLDYQVDKELSKQRFQRTYMLNWIVDSVVKDFTIQQEKATLAQCISDLKTLGNKMKTANV